MKPLFFLLLVISAVSCRKQSSTEEVKSLTKKAISYYEKRRNSDIDPASKQYRKTLRYSPNWSQAKVAGNVTNQHVIVPIIYEKEILVRLNSEQDLYNLNDISYIEMIPTNTDEFKIRLLTIIPFSTTSQSVFNGIVKIENLENDVSYSLKYENGKKYISSNKESPVRTDGAIEIAHYINGYNYSPKDPDGGYAWQEYIGSSYINIPNSYGGGGYDPGSYNDLFLGSESEVVDNITPTNFIIPAGDDRITNITTYTKCFTNKPGSSFQVTLYVQQPIPHSRATWRAEQGPELTKTKSPVFVGHTFLALKQTAGTETTVRNIGYYPAEAVDPLSPMTSGELNNDENRRYDISLSINLNYDQFSHILSYINSGVRYYNLNTFNCTTFVLEALSKGGINLPRTNGSWPNGGGLNPGDLGEDIRDLKLSPNMTKSTTASTHKNTGTCN